MSPSAAEMNPNNIMSRIENDFTFHAATETSAKQHDDVRAVLKQTAQVLSGIVPAGREHSLMLTHLEEAMFWANAAIARNQ